MTEILSITIPVYLIMIAGFTCVRTGYLDGAVITALSTFTVKVSLPALIFSAIALSDAETALNWTLSGGYLLASMISMMIGYLVMRRGFAQARGASWIHGLGVANSNSGFIGYSIAALVFPEVALQVLAWIMIVENVVVIPFAIIAAEIASGAGGGINAAARKAGASFLRNPLVIAVALALAVRSSGAPLPIEAVKVIEMISSVAPVVALFVVGGIIARYNISPMWRRTAAITIGKLVLHPALVFAVLTLLIDAGDPVVLTAVLIAAVPMLSIYPILGAAHGAEQVCATALVTTTLVSFLTVSALIWVISGCLSGSPSGIHF